MSGLDPFAAFDSTLRECRGSASECAERALLKALRARGYADFDALKAESVIEGILVNEGPLHIEAGAEAPVISPVDLAVLRVRCWVGREPVEVPVIPGSSLKGVLRSLGEAYAAARGWLVPEVEVAGKHLVCTADGLADVEKHLRKEEFVRAWPGIPEDVRRAFVEKCLCSPIVGLFGAPWLASHVKFYDAVPLPLAGGSGRLPTTSVVTRVGIDRLTGGQRPGVLYTLEYVEPGYEWGFKLRLLNVLPGDERWELVKFLLGLLERGVHVGRRTSAGMGLVRLDPGRTRVKVVRAREWKIETRELSLREWLGGGWA